jgi:hypothetical protein
MKEEDGYDELKEEEEEWGVRRGIEYCLVPSNMTDVMSGCVRQAD